MTDTNLAFVDVETTGLDPQVHHVWEVCVITLAGDVVYGRWPVPLKGADRGALEIGRYHERTAAMFGTRRDLAATVDAEWQTARDVARVTAGLQLAGASVHFDLAMLDRWLRDNGTAPAWSYRVTDVTTYASGVSGGAGATSLRHAVATWLDVDIIDAYDTHGHTAAWDAWCARQVWIEAADQCGHLHRGDVPEVTWATVAAQVDRWPDQITGGF